MNAGELCATVIRHAVRLPTDRGFALCRDMQFGNRRNGKHDNHLAVNGKNFSSWQRACFSHGRSDQKKEKQK